MSEIRFVGVVAVHDDAGACVAVEGVSLHADREDALRWAEESVKTFCREVEDGERNYAIFDVTKPTLDLLADELVERWLAEAEAEADEDA